jgi:hypothetical protein
LGAFPGVVSYYTYYLFHHQGALSLLLACILVYKSHTSVSNRPAPRIRSLPHTSSALPTARCRPSVAYVADDALRLRFRRSSPPDLEIPSVAGTAASGAPTIGQDAPRHGPIAGIALPYRDSASLSRAPCDFGPANASLGRGCWGTGLVLRPIAAVRGSSCDAVIPHQPSDKRVTKMRRDTLALYIAPAACILLRLLPL